MLDAIVAGHLCVDIIPTISAEAAASPAFLAPGRLVEVGEAVLSTGGCVSNTGLALHRLGMDVTLVARLGADTIGQLTRDLLSRRDPRLVEGLMTREGEPSSYSIVVSAPGRDRSFIHCPGTNDSFGPEDISDELLDSARLLHLGYPPLMRRMFIDGGQDLTTIFRRAKARGLTCSLDMSMPDPARPSGQADWRAILERTIPYVDLFVPSLEELLYMLRPERYDEVVSTVGAAGMIDAIGPDEIAGLAEQALALGAKVMLLKLGHRGLYLRTASVLGDLGRATPFTLDCWMSREFWSPCFQVQVAGTVGAGDATIAGFIAAFLNGQTPEEAATSAAAVGACNVERPDATSGVRGWQETQDRVAEGWPRHPMSAPAAGWSLMPSGVWKGPRDLPC